MENRHHSRANGSGVGLDDDNDNNTTNNDNNDDRRMMIHIRKSVVSFHLTGYHGE